MNTQDEKLQAFAKLLQIMDELRVECPWDKKQTMESLRHLSIEETYELSEAILANNLPEIKNELGDLALHIVFYSKIASETQDFDIADVLNGVCEKLIRRHPHIYGDTKVEGEKDVKENWENIKLKEGKNKTVLGGVPKSLPALLKAYRIQEKVRGVGFDWEEKNQVWEKVEEELQEFKENFDAEKNELIDKERATGEFGDLLFSLINYARFLDINPETALEKTNQKFTKRFNYLEQKSKDLNKSLEEMTLAEMDVFWEEAKKLD